MEGQVDTKGEEGVNVLILDVRGHEDTNDLADSKHDLTKTVQVLGTVLYAKACGFNSECISNCIVVGHVDL